MTADPDQIRSRIEDTRSNLSADVNALTEKVSPGRVVARRVDRTRDALTNVKNKIMGSAESATSAVGDKTSSMASGAADLASSAADTVTSAPEVARRRTQGSPLAAGLIAFGAGWLVASLVPASRKEQELAEQAKDQLGQQLQPVAEQAKQTASGMADSMREPAQQAVESVKSTVGDAASTMAGESRAAAGQVSDRADEARQNVGKYTG
jgi:ElaB/YqjD/DUF883 family membrane-anchored ribosome-binding protein